MELNNIEKLIEKYFAGNTTLRQEEILHQYFTTQKVPNHLQCYQYLFGYYKVKRQEVFEKPVKIPNQSKMPYYKWLSVAAMLIFVLGVYIISQKPTKTNKAQLLADYQTAQQALQLISKNLNKGTYAMAQLQEFDIAKNKVFKNNKK